MAKSTKDLLEFWEDQMKLSHTSSNYFFRKSPSHYHMMLLVMSAFKQKQNLSVEELKTKLFKTSRPKSALIINEACEKGFFYLEKTAQDQRKKHIKPSASFISEFNDYLSTLKNRKHTDVIGSDEINRNIVHGTRSALGQFNDQVNESRGTLAFQGMENSVLNQQIGLDERQELADSLNTSANDLRAEARVENRNARMDAEDQFYELKSALAERRRATKEQAFGDMVDGATGVVGYLNEPKYLASLKNQGTPTQPQVMGYTPSASTGGNLGQGQSALNFGRQRALGKPNTCLLYTSPSPRDS